MFYDMGLVWDDNSTIRWKRRVGDSPTGVRTPLKTVGFALRTNLFGFAIARLDYSVPQDRPRVGGPLDVQPGADVLGGRDGRADRAYPVIPSEARDLLSGHR